MRVFFDTNILISAMIWPKSNPAKAVSIASSYPNVGVICDESVNEMIRIINKKFPQYISVVEKFLFKTITSLDFVHVPPEHYEIEELIRDIKDRPLLRAAIKAEADLFLTGDKDFLEAGIENPRIISIADFIELFS